MTTIWCQLSNEYFEQNKVVVLFLIITISIFALFHSLLGLRMKMHLLELVYVPAIRLFQRYKTMDANTATASNEPIMKYHCTVVLAEKTKRH